jgi:hypothetical protein
MMMLQVLQEVLRRRRCEGWLVGGFVRDRRLGRFSPDLDVVVTDDPAAVARELATSSGSPWFPLSARHGAYRVLVPDGHVDLARMRGAGIEDDLSRRDFTINAMAVPLLALNEDALRHEGGLGFDEHVLDPFGGRAHLAAGRLVAVSERIFSDDPLRLMRAVRLEHVLGLTLDADLEAMVRAQSDWVAKAAAERVMAELALTLEPAGSGAAVRRLQDLGLLQVFMPEAGHGVATLLECLDEVLTLGSWQGAPWRRALEERVKRPVDGGLSRPVALRLAALVHESPSGRAAAIGRRLKLSGAAVSLLQASFGWFQRTAAAGLAPGEGLAAASATPRSSTLFCWETSPWEPEVVLVAAAASMAAAGASASGASPGSAPSGLISAELLLQHWARRADGLAPAPFDGDLLMAELGLAEGPVLGRVLSETRLAWEAGEVHGLADSLALAREVRASSPTR